MDNRIDTWSIQLTNYKSGIQEQNLSAAILVAFLIEYLNIEATNDNHIDG